MFVGIFRYYFIIIIIICINTKQKCKLLKVWKTNKYHPETYTEGPFSSGSPMSSIRGAVEQCLLSPHILALRFRPTLLQLWKHRVMRR